MAFNSGVGAVGAKRRVPQRLTSNDYPSSIFSESQVLWVVFELADRMDVLSLSTNNPLTSTEEDFIGEDSGEEASIEDEFIESDFEKVEGDAEIVGVPSTPPFRNAGNELIEREEREAEDSKLEPLASSLHKRVNEWQHATETEVSDNMASWDLDAALVEQLLDSSLIRPVPALYGDLYFETCTPADFARFKRASKRLKGSLTRKGYSQSSPALLTLLLELLQWQRLLKSLGSLVQDYVMNTIARTNMGSSFNTAEISDSAPSSIVMCGPSSWNDA